MIRVSKSVFAVSGAVLAAGLIGLTGPSTVHALAAALVQVTNTAANPVVTQGVREQASQTVRLRCSESNMAVDCAVASPVGQFNVPAYVVPSNESLIITAMDVTFFDCQAQVGAFTLTDSVDDSTPNGSIRWDWALPVSSANINGQTVTNHLTFPAGGGPLIHSGDTVRITPVSCSTQVDAYGYLTAS